jgi:hypothetical protein
VKDILQGTGKRDVNENAPSPSQKGAVH